MPTLLRALTAGLALAALAAYGCGSGGSTTGSGTTSGHGGSGGATTGHGGSTATSSTGHGGHGGAPMATCPMTPPNNGDSCAGFAEGQQCNYGSSTTGTVMSTECQCGGGSIWSCGTEAVGAGTGASSSG
jgi:hypothetical protein